MPYIYLQTNIECATSQEFIKGLSKESSNLLGKPERVVMVAVDERASMCLAGSLEPLIYLEVKSIGLTPSVCPALAAGFTSYLSNATGIDASRIYIEFSSPSGEMWGANGNTIA